jgi:site-specific recombinase XerD
MVIGVDIYTVSRLLGHTYIKTTMTYAKKNIETLKAVVERLDKFGYVLVMQDGKDENGQ